MKTHLQSSKQVIMKHEGKTSQFKLFYESLKAAANTSVDLVRCIENKVYKESMPELNNMLCNWVLVHVHSKVTELLFYPQKGNRNAVCSPPVNGNRPLHYFP
jgi:hypothetical protein